MNARRAAALVLAALPVSALAQPSDAEYTRNLGYGAVKFLMSKEAAEYGAIVSFVGGKMVPLKFDDMIDPATSRMRARLVCPSAQKAILR